MLVDLSCDGREEQVDFHPSQNQSAVVVNETLTQKNIILRVGIDSFSSQTNWRDRLHFYIFQACRPNRDCGFLLA